VVVNNKQKATLSDGQQITQLIVGGVGTPGSSVTVNANLGLDVTPQVTSHGSVQMFVTISKDAIVDTATTTTSINTTRKQLTTDVLVDSGSTLVLGGVYQVSSGKTNSGIPVLKDLPFIGQIFRVNTERSSKSELLVFITPQIIDPEASTQTL
jgi:type IV pilus assembly protein PilQ